MAAADDYKGRAVLTIQSGPIVASLGGASVGQVQNAMTSIEAQFPDNLPSTHRTIEFAGRTTPDNTDYPDSVAPIGSTFRKYVVTAGVVTGFTMYHKVAAATWQAVTTS